MTPPKTTPVGRLSVHDGTGRQRSGRGIGERAHEMDDRTYRQEFEASFETLGVGRAYHAFDRANNVKNYRFNPQLVLNWSLDFNIPTRLHRLIIEFSFFFVGGLHAHRRNLVGETEGR